MFGRYRVLGEIGSGGMGRVYKAVDTVDGPIVALKVLFETDARGLARINREFRRMVDISHRNLVALYELGSAGLQRFIVMEFVPGLDFIRGLRPGGAPCEPGRLREAVRELTLGVHALHRRDRVHRDLKPSNVMVSEHGRVVILDFGLVNEIHRKTVQSSSMGMAGTPMYMAPEQAAGQLATPASDWYAVGVMLFEVVTGRVPFSGTMIQQMLDKQHTDAPPPSFYVPTIEPELDRLIHGLLSREPGHRPSAHDLIAWCDGNVHVRLTRQPPPHVPLRELIGFDRHQQALEGAYHRVVQQRQPVIVDVFGPSGTGKTALVQTFLAEVRRHEATVVLEGRCFAQDSVNYKAFDSVMDSLANCLRRLPAIDLESLLDDSFAALRQIFPILKRVPYPADHGGEAGELDAALGVDAVQAELRRRLGLGPALAPDDVTSRTRGLRGLKLLLYRLALRSRLVIVIDDLQWGDADSARLIADLLAPPSAPPLLFIGVWRSEDAGRSPLLRALAVQRDRAPIGGMVALETGPLDADDATRLALQRLGNSDPAAQHAARMIARESGGNPMLIEALVNHVELQIGPVHLDAPERQALFLEQFIQRRLRTLSPEAYGLLALVAVAGQPVTQNILMRAARPSGDLRPALGQLRAERLIRTATHEPTAVEIYHDRIRIGVVRTITRQELAQYHHNLAEALLEVGSDDHERLARHLFAAGERERAAEYAADAAHIAERTFAFEHAAALYRLVSACRPQDWLPKRKAADALSLAGRTREAVLLYLAAADQAPASATGRILRAAAESLMITGQLEQGVATLRPLLAAVGAPYPEKESQANVQLLAQLDMLEARGLAYSERSESQLSGGQLAAIDTCWSAAKGLIIADPVRGGFYAVRAAALALDAGEPRRIIRALALAATVASARTPAVSQRWLQKAEQIAVSIKDSDALGFVVINSGVIQRSRGAWHDALEALADGLHQLVERHLVVTWERSFAVTSLLSALEALGEIRRLAAETSRLARQAQEAGDQHTAIMAAIFCALVKVARGDLEGARERLRPMLEGWPGEAPQVHLLHMLKIQVDCDLYAGDAPGAWRRVLDQWPMLEQLGFSRLSTRRTEVFHLRARAALALLAHDPGPNLHLRAIVDSDLEQLAREPMIHARPLEAMLRASLYAIAGDQKAVLQRLSGAIYGFDAAGMSLFATVARRCKGQWTEGREGRKIVQQADMFMRMQDIAEPQRWGAMVAPGFMLGHASVARE